MHSISSLRAKADEIIPKTKKLLFSKLENCGAQPQYLSVAATRCVNSRTFRRRFHGWKEEEHSGEWREWVERKERVRREGERKPIVIFFGPSPSSQPLLSALLSSIIMEAV